MSSIERLVADHGDAFLRVHADCMPVMGVAKAAIYDLTRHQIFVVPGGYYRLLEHLTSEPVAAVLNGIESSAHAGKVVEFVQYLLENELADFVHEPASFPPINDSWDVPGLIQNAIIDVDTVRHDFATLIRELDGVSCRYLQLRCFSSLLDVAELRAILGLVMHSELESVELILKYDATVSDEAYATLAFEHPKLTAIFVHSAPVAREHRVDLCDPKVSHPMFKRVIFLTRQIRSQLDCGGIDVQALNAPSVETFYEARSYNGCLNRKIAIDSGGQVRNCPSLVQSFGSAGKRRLKVIAESPDFQRAWHLKKDDIDVCQRCELRYACSDCRAYLEHPNEGLSKPLKCGYDPVTGVWSDWPSATSNQAAIIHYQLDA